MSYTNRYSKKKKKLNYKKVFIVFFLVVIVSILLIFKITTKNQNEELNIIEEGSNYILKIDYPEVHNDELNKNIRNDIEELKNEFLENIEGLKGVEGERFDFTSSYTIKKFNNIDSIHVTTYYFTGGNHYIRNDKAYHYNNENNQKLELEDFLINNNKIEDLKNVAHYHIGKYYEKVELEYDSEMIDSGLNEFEEIFADFYFNESGLNIIFPECTVAPSYVGEIYLTIPYSELENILKNQYIIKETKEVSVNNQRNLEDFKDKKLIAFTFDDGPNKSTTNKLLDGLDKYNARVTFFVLGSRIDSHKETLIRAYQMGNQIGNHSYAHPNLAKLEDYLVLKELNDTNAAIKSVLGIEPKILRPPYGSTNKNIHDLTSMNIIMWSVDTLDWKYRDKDKVKNEIVNNAKDGAIVLLHDLYESSVDATLLAMEELEKQGYAFVTIDEMIQLKNIELTKEKIYYNLIK